MHEEQEDKQHSEISQQSNRLYFQRVSKRQIDVLTYGTLQELVLTAVKPNKISNFSFQTF